MLNKAIVSIQVGVNDVATGVAAVPLDCKFKLLPSLVANDNVLSSSAL